MFCVWNNRVLHEIPVLASPCPWNNYKTRHGRWHPLSWPKNAAAISQQNIQQNKKPFNIDPLSRVLKYTIYSRNVLRGDTSDTKWESPNPTTPNFLSFRMFPIKKTGWTPNPYFENKTNVIMVSFLTRFWILVVKAFWDFSRSCGGSASEFSPKSRSLDAVGLERHFVGKNSPLQKPKGVFLMTLSISI